MQGAKSSKHELSIIRHQFSCVVSHAAIESLHLSARSINMQTR